MSKCCFEGAKREITLPAAFKSERNPQTAQGKFRKLVFLW